MNINIIKKLGNDNNNNNNNNPKVNFCKRTIAFNQKCYLVVCLSSLNLYRHTCTITSIE